MKAITKAFWRILIYYFASMIFSLFASIILDIPLKFLIPNFNSLTNFIIGVVTLCIFLFLIFFYDGYKTKKFELLSSLISLAMLLFLVIIISSIIGHALYISGPTIYLAKYIIGGPQAQLIIDFDLFNQYSMVLMIICFVFFIFPNNANSKLLWRKIQKENRHRQNIV